ncbi:glycosyltransferase [Algibacillus agarilyticus]|uniref:glycosyltransferase n=1 Tax=Algibacillus agarilyticus TaxID=2234133 RepID=UPI000DD0367C|nr:glycosyltransferase [Algibacillus agarilyticus]
MTKKHLIVFGEDWGGLPSSTQHFIKHLASDHKIIWVNSIGLRQPNFTLSDVKRVGLKIGALLFKNILKTHTQCNETGDKNPFKENITFINPITIPAPKSKLMRWLARGLLKLQILPQAKKQNFEQPILWLSLATAVDMVGHLNESKVIYYCGDDFSSLAGVDHKTVQQREIELTQKADLIVTASQTLKERFPAHKTHCIEHGVDIDLFSTPTIKADDLPKGNRPIAGFYGSINTWFDIDLLVKTAKALPNWDFVIIGQVHIDVRRLKLLNHVTFLGPKPHSTLPRYSQHWTVSILPFVLNEQIDACNPLKITEYLAAGSPVISTRYKAAEHYMGFIHLIDNHRDMIKALNAIAQEPALPPLKRSLQARVKQQSWYEQSNKLNLLLDAL